MGQYWLTVNVTKREFIHPHKLGVGLKLGEQVGSWPGTGPALLVLLADMPEPRGGGDLAADLVTIDDERVIGRWIGDQIVVIGDYAADEDGDPLGGVPRSELYDRCRESDDGRAPEFRDISGLVATVLELEFGGTFTGTGWRQWSDGAGAGKVEM